MNTFIRAFIFVVTQHLGKFIKFSNENLNIYDMNQIKVKRVFGGTNRVKRKKASIKLEHELLKCPK
jgi:hypothetical protein